MNPLKKSFTNKQAGALNFEVTIPEDGILKTTINIPPLEYDHVHKKRLTITVNTDLTVTCSRSSSGATIVYFFQKMEVPVALLGNGDISMTLRLEVSADGKNFKLYEKSGYSMYQIYLQSQKQSIYEIISDKTPIPKIPVDTYVPQDDTTYTFNFRAFLPEERAIDTPLEILKTKFGKITEKELLITLDSNWRINCSISNRKGVNRTIYQKMRLQENFSDTSGEAIADFTLKISSSLLMLIHNVGVRKYQILTEIQAGYNKEYIIPVLIYKKPIKRIFEDINPSLITDKQDRLFVFRVKELDIRINSVEDIQGDEFNLLSASALLRQFFLDDGGIAPAMAKKWQCTLLFDVMIHNRTSFPKDFTALIPLDPHAYHTKIWMEKTSLKDFFTTNVASILGEGLNIREVIKAVANGKGGVHAKLKAGETMQKELLNLDDMLNIVGQQASLSLLREIGNVTLHALKPIIASIMDANIQK
jgi:hypothetical protein